VERTGVADRRIAGHSDVTLRRMPHRVVMLSSFAILLGALTSFGIAAGLALRGWNSSAPAARYSIQENSTSEPYRAVVIRDRIGSTLYATRSFVEKQIEPGGLTRVPHYLRRHPDPSGHGGYWSSTCDYGWPFRCSYGTYDQIAEDPWWTSKFHYAPHYFLAIGRSSPTGNFLPNEYGGKAIPLGVIPTGLALDSFLYGGVWWMVLGGPRATRAWVRRSRDACPHCGYDTQTIRAANRLAPCPECGQHPNRGPRCLLS
jgi:hypothetical protein